MNSTQYGRRSGGKRFYYGDYWTPSPWDYNPRHFSGNQGSRGLSANNGFRGQGETSAGAFNELFPKRPGPRKVVEVVTLSSDDESIDRLQFNNEVAEEEEEDVLILNTVSRPKTISISSESELEGSSTHPTVPKVHWMHIDSPSKWTKRMKKFYNKISKRLRHLCHIRVIRGLREERSEWTRWDILESDIFPPRKKLVRCTFCRKTDHPRYKCPRRNLVVCHMCGAEGHKEPACPFKMCLNCGAKMQLFTMMCNTCLLNMNNKCSICDMVGHREELCPNHWRQYHSVTSGDGLPSLTSAVPAHKSCCNCGGSGHVFEECQDLFLGPYPPARSLVLRLPPSEEEVVVGEGKCLENPPLSLLVAEYKEKGLEVEAVKVGGGSALRFKGSSYLVAALKGLLVGRTKVPVAPPPWHPPSHHPRTNQKPKRKTKKKKKKKKVLPPL